MSLCCSFLTLKSEYNPAFISCYYSNHEFTVNFTSLATIYLQFFSLFGYKKFTALIIDKSCGPSWFLSSQTASDSSH